MENGTNEITEPQLRLISNKMEELSQERYEKLFKQLAGVQDFDQLTKHQASALIDLIKLMEWDKTLKEKGKEMKELLEIAWKATEIFPKEVGPEVRVQATTSIAVTMFIQKYSKR
jgi:hypothetical protein